MNNNSKDQVSKEEDLEFEHDNAQDNAFHANESTSLILSESEGKAKEKCFEKNRNTKCKFLIGGIIL